MVELQPRHDWEERHKKRIDRVLRWEKENWGQILEEWEASKGVVNQRVRARKERDPAFKLLCLLRSRLASAIKGNLKAARTIALVGIDVENLMVWIELQFDKGMSWENHGEWELDHVRPCCSFDFSDPQEQRACFHYSNLQPLWKAANRAKGGRYASSDTCA